MCHEHDDEFADEICDMCGGGSVVMQNQQDGSTWCQQCLDDADDAMMEAHLNGQ